MVQYGAVKAQGRPRTATANLGALFLAVQKHSPVVFLIYYKGSIADFLDAVLKAFGENFSLSYLA